MSANLLNIKSILVSFFIVLIFGRAYCQIYIPADPYNLLLIEKKMLSSNNDYISLITRPVFKLVDMGNNWSLKVRSEFFYNNSAPNLENMSDRWIGKGVGFFSSINVAYRNRYLAVSAEPYYFIDQNDDYIEPSRLPQFSRLNDNRAHAETPYIAYGIRELQIYANYRGVGGGFSNANMWWGPGLHSSLMMTNNTTGFGHLMLGTINEKRIKDWGFNGRYIFSKFNKKNKFQPFISGYIFNATYYSYPIITIGFSRMFLSGGKHAKADSISAIEAALLPFKGFFPNTKTVEEFEKQWSYDDQTVAGYLIATFPKSKLVIFLTVGKNDVAISLFDLILNPDHTIATNFGIRKYDIFGIPEIVFGIEYTKIFGERYGHMRPSRGLWYDRELYDFNSYNGRRWAAHSGGDSDDFTLFSGWLSDKFIFISSFNYERHGLRFSTQQIDEKILNGEIEPLNKVLHETKLEFRLNLRYKYKAYKLNLYYEREVTLNLGSRDKTRKGNVIWVGIERDITKDFIDLFSNKIFSK